MKRREYLNLIMRQKPAWILRSALTPSKRMTKTHVILHFIAIRKLV